MIKAFLIAAAILLFLPNLFTVDINPRLPYDHKEAFEPNLIYINSIDKLNRHIDSVVADKRIVPGSYDYVFEVVDLLRRRFYHGFSHFSLNENWIAALAGRVVKIDHACKVQPEKIMQHAYAACSQQALVLMAILRQKNIDYRSIGFPHHYAMEVFADGQWYYFDSNMEPDMTKAQRLGNSWHYKPDSLKKYYDTARFKDLDWKFGVGQTAQIGKMNEVPAQNATLFHNATGVLSKILWCVPLLILLYRNRQQKKRASNHPSTSQ